MIVSGKLELDYCVYARGNTPAKPMFVHWTQQLRQWYPTYMISVGEISQLQLIVDPRNRDDFLKKGISINLTVSGESVVVKKQTVEMALPDSVNTFQQVVDELSKIAQQIQNAHKDCLVTSRMVITSFVNEFVAV